MQRGVRKETVSNGGIEWRIGRDSVSRIDRGRQEDLGFGLTIDEALSNAEKDGKEWENRGYERKYERMAI